jgi:prepilin-type N-terminal cleavage/methylation domain-containing protein
LARFCRFGRRDNGFTLTELAIAMVVLGVIASIAIPSFLGSRNNAYDKEAQTSIENVLRAAKFHYQSQGDFSDASSLQCGDSAVLAADLQKLETNVDVVASSVSSTNSRIVSVQAVSTWNSNAELLGCQGFYAVALSSSGSCWAARLTIEGKFLASGSASPVVVNTQTNTSNKAITTWSALAVNGNAFGVLKPQTSAADGDNTNKLGLIKTACKARTQSTGVADLGGNYIAPSQFYSSWRDVVAAPYIATAGNCLTTDTCTAGAIGPGGGLVFYVASSPFTVAGSTCGTSCSYLEMAPKTWFGGASDPTLTWCTFVGDTSGSAIGTGFANTVAIEAGCASGAGYSAGAYAIGGISDWYLPSVDELDAMYLYKSSIPVGAYTFATGGIRYWTSTTAGSGWARCQYFDTTSPGLKASCLMGQSHYVRPIRAFG